MSIENARFAYHTVGILTLDDLLLLGEALPVQIGAELVRAEEEGELTVGMDLKRLGEESGFEFQCDFSPIGPDSRLGLCVRISPPRPQGDDH